MMLTASFRSRLTTRYDASVVRRVAVLLIFIGPAFLANLLVYYFTVRTLTAENFGLFYIASTITNVAFSGSLVLNIFFTRYLVQIRSTNAGDGIAATRRIQRVIGLSGAISSLVIFVVLMLLSKSLGATPLVALFIVVDTYASYLADIGRAFLQSRRQTWQLGCYTFVWMGLRLVFCVLGSAVFGTVWVTLLGSALAPALVFLGFQILLARASRKQRVAVEEQAKAPKLPPIAALLPVAFGYGLLIVISNLDILLTYFLLRDQEIGVYSASSVFPKGILVVTMPISQMLFGVMMGDHKSADVFRAVVHKTIWVILALSFGASFSVWLLSPWMCGGTFGLRLCAPVPLHLLLVSAVLLSVLRIIVLLEFVRQRDWLILVLIIPTIVYLLFAWNSRPGIYGFALQFTIFSAAALAFFAAVQWGFAPRPINSR
jgi:O-antigen/teichoic acid export membrane protein